jgi:hypothetical protein
MFSSKRLSFVVPARHVFDGHMLVNAVLIEQVDDVCSETFEQSLSHFLDVDRAAV